jgi:bla regulator protein BlaR1
MSEIFGYVILVALLVGLAAASVERLLAEVHAPRRFAWLGAFAAALTAPPVFWLLTDATPALPTTSVGAISVEPFAAVALIDWDTALLWLWIITTTVLVMLYVAAWYRLALLAKRWRSETSDAASIVVADDLGPAVLGVLRPRVVLPRWLMDAPAAVRTTVVAHELEHIAARDQACIVAAQVVTILLPWNLPLWWFVRRLRAAIEIDCDARVLQRGVDPAQYANVLLTVGQHGRTCSYITATLIEPVTQLERRIRIVLTRRSTSLARTSAAAGLALVLAACATQLEPPVLETSAAPPDMGDGFAPRYDIELNSLDAFRVTKPAEGGITMESSKLVMRVADRSQGRGTSIRARRTSDRLLEGSASRTAKSVSVVGNLQMAFEDVSISASAAQGTQEPNGDWVWTLSDAKIVRASTSGE